MSKQLDSILGKVAAATPEVKPKRTQEAVEPERLLQAKVPASVSRAVGLRAAETDVTTRSVILQGLAAIGIAVPEEELRDRRRP